LESVLNLLKIRLLKPISHHKNIKIGELKVRIFKIPFFVLSLSHVEVRNNWPGELKIKSNDELILKNEYQIIRRIHKIYQKYARSEKRNLSTLKQA
jgi:hypothetical protein